MSEGSVFLLDPTAEGLPEFVPAAKRLRGFQDTRLGLLDNIKHNSECLLSAVGEELARRFDCQVQMVRKRAYTKPAEPGVLDELRGCDAVITAIGD